MSNTRKVKPQNLHVRDTTLGPAFDALSLFSGATESQRLIMTLWAAHTYVYDMFAATPRLDFCADGPGTGKTINMQVTLALCANPLVVGYASQASVYSWLDEHPNTTFGFDEVDKVFGATGRKTSRSILASVINDGYTPKGRVMVMRNGHAVQMPVFCPIAMAGIGSLPEDTQTRAIMLHMHKAIPSEVYVPELHEDSLQFIGSEIKEWIATRDAHDYLSACPNMAEITSSDPRLRLIYAPLAAIASYAGCHEQFCAAVEEIQTGIIERPPTPLHTLALEDLRESWPSGATMLSGDDAIRLLRSHDGGRWAHLETGRIGNIALAGLMRSDGIETRTSNGTRGYRADDVLTDDELRAIGVHVSEARANAAKADAMVAKSIVTGG